VYKRQGYGHTLYDCAQQILTISQIATPIPAQIRTVYQSRQPWQADNSPFLEHYREEHVEDFDAYMSDVAKK